MIRQKMHKFKINACKTSGFVLLLICNFMCVYIFIVREGIKMENDTLLRTLEEKMHSFSKGQKRIANFILNQYDKAAYITAAKLGFYAGVSESTVVRFASELGYDGYPAMQKEIKAMIRTKLTAAQRLEVTSDRIKKDDILTAVLESDTENIKSTIEEIDKTQFEKITQAIINAKNVYVVGVRSSAALASFFCFYLNLIRSNVRLVQSATASELFEQIFRIGDGDVLIGISFPRYSKRTLKAIKYAKNKNATVVSITDSKTAPAAEESNYCLVAKSETVSVVDSLVAPLSVINALLVSICMSRESEVLAAFNKLENIWDEYQVYEKESTKGTSE